MNCTCCQLWTHSNIMAVGRYSPYHISRVNVFESDFDSPLFGILNNLFFEKAANILHIKYILQVIFCSWINQLRPSLKQYLINLGHQGQHPRQQLSPNVLFLLFFYAQIIRLHDHHRDLNIIHIIPNLAYGIKQRSTSRLAFVASIAINPASLPINLTSPIPYSAPIL